MDALKPTDRASSEHDLDALRHHQTPGTHAREHGASFPHLRAWAARAPRRWRPRRAPLTFTPSRASLFHCT